MDEKLDQILAEYFTWKGESIHEVNQTASYKRMKAKLKSLLSQREREVLESVDPKAWYEYEDGSRVTVVARLKTLAPEEKPSE